MGTFSLFEYHSASLFTTNQCNIANNGSTDAGSLLKRVINSMRALMIIMFSLLKRGISYIAK